MKSRYTTWEVIVAGCIFMALGIYLITPSDLSTFLPESSDQQVHIEESQDSEKNTASTSGTVIIDPEELESLEQLKELEQIKKEIDNLEKELKAHTLEQGILSLPSLKSLSEILIYSK